MPLLNYRKEFAPLVESGEKRQTIRAFRKRLIKPGDRLYHYTGLRTKHCRKLLESDCATADRIKFYENGNVRINAILLHESVKESLAFDDGFRRFGHEWEDMFEFFRTVHGLPFTGQLIMW